MDSNVLILFTLHYPYSKTSETFLNPEIKYLSQRFKRVILIPWKKEEEGIKSLPLPDNVEIVNILLDLKLNKRYQYLFAKHLLYWPLFFRIYLFTLVYEKSPSPYLKSAYFLYNMMNAFERALVLQKYIKTNNLEGAIFYDYWFENSTLSLAMLRDLGSVSRIYSRSHGFDVFDERWACGAVPFRSYKLSRTTRHFTISDYNKAYFEKKVNKKLYSKIEVAYLGVEAQNTNKDPCKERAKNRFIVVSSANLFDFKQVHLMPELLNLIDLPITWYHFGDGPMKRELLSNAKKLNNKIEFNFMGHVAHPQLLAFYRTHHIDLFISLSTKEGLPVSMMEVASFGIPMVGYDVFGIPEIVNASTGLLFDLKDSFTTMAPKIRSLLLEDRIKPLDVLQFFNENFNAETNYNQMVNTMLKVNPS